MTSSIAIKNKYSSIGFSPNGNLDHQSLQLLVTT